uniref:hypothetical protein n=1 Tax=Acidovorax sp. SUPP3334 TaxID=2920881 RepID=UPI002952946E|nr:hypothetical protein [Acidovorax sp. SUPP3334]BDH38367.1 hypothetical protein AVHM3334_23210 [Acidovorax sp. SUPP3334]
MTGDPPKEKKTRRKRRVPGTDKPPRKAFSLRIEQATFERMKKMLKSFNGSRNEYIERLIEFDLDYRDRIAALDTPLLGEKPRRI